MDEIAEQVPLYAAATYREMEPGLQQPLDGAGPKKAELQAVPAVAAPTGDGFLLTTGRGLYASYEGAAIHSPEADKLRREEVAEIHPDDARELDIAEGQKVTLRGNGAELTLPARLTDAVQPRTVYVPFYYDGGALTSLFAAGQAAAAISVSAARA